MNKLQRREELLMDMQEIETTLDMGYFESNMKLDLYCIKEALLALENEECEVKNKKRNKLNRHKINKKFKNKDKKVHITWKERSLKQCMRKRAERKVRYSVVGQENFLLKGCGYHKVDEWTWNMD